MHIAFAECFSITPGMQPETAGAGYEYLSEACRRDRMGMAKYCFVGPVDSLQYVAHINLAQETGASQVSILADPCDIIHGTLFPA